MLSPAARVLFGSKPPFIVIEVGQPPPGLLTREGNGLWAHTVDRSASCFVGPVIGPEVLEVTIDWNGVTAALGLPC